MAQDRSRQCWRTTNTTASGIWARARSQGWPDGRCKRSVWALASAGFVVLAPDAVGFEDRRHTAVGIERRADDWSQYFSELTYRLVAGRLLATTVLGNQSSIA